MYTYRELLLRAVAMLAESPQTQEAYVKQHGVAIDELALEFDDVFPKVSETHKHPDLTQREQDALCELFRFLYRMSGQQNAHLWTLDALRQSAEWNGVRRLARNALLEMNKAIGK